ncbi:MAG: hypothetical protein ACTSO2_04895, partial [Promethearchaeota archaeon]
MPKSIFDYNNPNEENNENLPKFVPYDELLPGFEAVYIPKKWKVVNKRGQPSLRFIDKNGNKVEKWSVWTWVFPHQWPKENEWWMHEEINIINSMQLRLGELSDDIRKIRSHIGSLVLCHERVPLSINEILRSIGKLKLVPDIKKAGCWPGGMGDYGDLSLQKYSEKEATIEIQIIEKIILGYLFGQEKELLIKDHPYAKGFIERIYFWLGPREKLQEWQELLLKRMLLPFEFFSRRNKNYWEVRRLCFERGRVGHQMDQKICEIVGLPEIPAALDKNAWDVYNENLHLIKDPTKRKIYEIVFTIARGLYGLSDCHHNKYRIIENWIHSIGTLETSIRERIHGTERRRLGQILFSYAFGLDKWLLGVPMNFILLDLGYIDLNFDIKTPLMYIYESLGPKTAVKQWLVACLWYNLCYNSMGGLENFDAPMEPKYKEIHEIANNYGLSWREWMDMALEQAKATEIPKG